MQNNNICEYYTKKLSDYGCGGCTLKCHPRYNKGLGYAFCGLKVPEEYASGGKTCEVYKKENSKSIRE